MPPGFSAAVGQLETFVLPERLSGSLSDRAMAKAMVRAWRRHGILQIAMSPSQQQIYAQANAASRDFFKAKPPQKQACVNDCSYAGYVASGEEITAGIADYSEIFTVTKDLHPKDPRVLEKWPCHGSCPWLDKRMKSPMLNYMADMGSSGDKVLRLIELGLDVPQGSLTKYTQDGWHHMRVLRYVVDTVRTAFTTGVMILKLSFSRHQVPCETPNQWERQGWSWYWISYGLWFASNSSSRRGWGYGYGFSESK
ncbi:hypothetical protein J3458_015714 [Metarhizium acridum]|uniref:uncharacterized protein n=1 Tax=Metarhizium acridum TaxID=92637 RepID=UPI001C6B0E75|nr:hypothetical protein J3458_015714 [Metarhizium acridum]